MPDRFLNPYGEAPSLLSEIIRGKYASRDRAGGIVQTLAALDTAYAGAELEASSLPAPERDESEPEPFPVLIDRFDHNQGSIIPFPGKHRLKND